MRKTKKNGENRSTRIVFRRKSDFDIDMKKNLCYNIRVVKINF